MTENKPANVSIGILIIGSLYWDNRRKRQTWRDSRLNMEDRYDVTARIRYGRKSEGRDNTYTMVFSRQAGEGQAKVVRCRNDVLTAAHLNTEAEHLWAAERNREPDGLIAADWGCVALLGNPDSEIPAELVDGWAARVADIAGYGNILHAPGEAILVSDRGLLQVPWPTLVGSLDRVPLDLLLVTANRPTLQGEPEAYATPAMIADAWLAKEAVKKNRVEYFRNNVANGINTFEDDAIRARLES
jgi:hypothetical protein